MDANTNLPNIHLPGIDTSSHRTSRIQTRVLSSGPQDGEPVLFLHGNLTTATIWEETMLALPPRYHAVAPDLRGYGFSDPNARIDATRGVADWMDDALALADLRGWDRFHLVAHSLGGCVAWGILGAYPSRLYSATLVGPGPPCGFGGAHGDRGDLNHEDGAGSGGGLVNEKLVSRLEVGERDISDEFFSPRAAMNRLYWKPPFRPEREEQLVTAMLQVHLGQDHFPGDWRSSPHWPGYAPGRFGPINGLSPFYNGWVLPQLIDALEKPRLLWVYGADDAIVCDESLSDVGTQGKLGLRDGWPGEDVFPCQPVLSQVKYALDQYEQTGGTVQRLVLSSVGHTPFVEQPAPFRSALTEHLSNW